MAQAITKYVAADGKEFTNEQDANAHDSNLANAGVINAFLDKYYAPDPTKTKQGPGRSLAGKAIALWLADQAAATAA